MIANVKKDRRFILCCLVPACVLTLVFLFLPLVRGLSLSLTNSSAISIDGDFVGLKNYRDMFHDEYFYQALWNTFVILGIVPILTNLIALLLAFFITQGKLRESSFYRFMFFMPSIISATVVGILWANLYSPTLGLFKQIFEFFGLKSLAQISWLGDSRYVLWAIIITMIWQSAGYYMVMYIASIDGIDAAVFEAATIDGCGTFGKIFRITIPLMKDMIGVTLVLTISSTIRMSYIIIAAMTQGGPSGASTVILTYMYQQAFQQSNFGYAMAIAVFTMALSIVLSLVSKRISSGKKGD